jgi:O-antigen/teichoic acid export membrane protein
LFSFLRRGAWGVGDQAFSSLTNFAVGIFVARSVGRDDFGAFTLVFATYLVALSASRAVATQPFVVRFSDASRAEWDRAARWATGTVVLTGLGGGVACLLVGWVVRGTLGEAFRALGITLPGLLLQDSWRFIFFSRRRGAAAFANDLIWAVAIVPAFVLVQVAGRPTVFWIVLAWGAAANVAALAGVVQAGGIVPNPSKAIAWLVEQGDLAPRYLGELLALSGSTQIALYGISAVAGLAAAGAIRAGQILLGPVYVLFVGIQLIAVPEGVRLLKRSVRRLREVLNLLSAGLLVAILAFGAIMYFLPDRWGEALLGRSWVPAHSVLIPVTISMAAAGPTMSALVGLRALVAARESLRARLIQSGAQVVAGVLGAAVGGALGAAWGMAVGIWLGVVVWRRYLTRGLREREIAASGGGRRVGAPDREPDALSGPGPVLPEPESP